MGVVVVVVVVAVGGQGVRGVCHPCDRIVVKMGRLSVLLAVAVLALSFAFDASALGFCSGNGRCKLDSFRAKKFRKRFKYVKGFKQCTSFSSTSSRA